MITEKKILIYEKYDGFIEAYIFKNGDLPNEDFELMDWSLIDELIGAIILINSGKVSCAFKIQLQKDIERETENGLVIEKLWEIAQKRKSNLL